MEQRGELVADGRAGGRRDGTLIVSGNNSFAGDYTSASGFISGGGVLHAGPPPGTLFLVR